MLMVNYYKVEIVNGSIILTSLGQNYTPVKPSPFDLKLTTTGVISVNSRCGKKYVSGYWPFQSGYCLDWPGKILLELDRLVKDL